MTKRRSFLAGVSLLPIAGCLTAPSANGGGPLPGDDGNGSGSTRPSGTGGPGLRLVSTDGQPDGPLEIGVEVTRDTATGRFPDTTAWIFDLDNTLYPPGARLFEQIDVRKTD